MRLLLVLLLVGGVASADAPKGRYRLEVEEGWQPINGPTKDRVRSCGPRASDFIANIGTLKVEVANDVRVNGIVWKPGPESPNRNSVTNDQLLKGFVLQVTFYRNDSRAKGILVVVGLSDGVLQCGDALRLDGRYSR